MEHLLYVDPYTTRELPASTSAISQQCTGTGSSGHQASGPRESAFSLLQGSLAHEEPAMEQFIRSEKASRAGARRVRRSVLQLCTTEMQATKDPRSQLPALSLTGMPSCTKSSSVRLTARLSWSRKSITAVIPRTPRHGKMVP